MNIPINQSPLFRLQNGPWRSVSKIKEGKFLLIDRNRVQQFPLSLKCGKYSAISRYLRRCRFSKFSKDGESLGWMRIRSFICKLKLKIFLVCLSEEDELLVFSLSSLTTTPIPGLPALLQPGSCIRAEDLHCEVEGDEGRVEVVLMTETSVLHWSGRLNSGGGSWSCHPHSLELSSLSHLSFALHHNKGRVEHSHWSRLSRYCPLIGPDCQDTVLSFVQIVEILSSHWLNLTMLAPRSMQ